MVKLGHSERRSSYYCNLAGYNIQESLCEGTQYPACHHIKRVVQEVNYSLIKFVFIDEMAKHFSRHVLNQL